MFSENKAVLFLLIGRKPATEEKFKDLTKATRWVPLD
jgi:hypothetical protein